MNRLDFLKRLAFAPVALPALVSLKPEDPLAWAMGLDSGYAPECRECSYYQSVERGDFSYKKSRPQILVEWHGDWCSRTKFNGRKHDVTGLLR